MTAQQHEIIILNGEEYGMASTPLTPYLNSLVDKPKFIFQHTACWRGYLGTWELKNNKLFLIDLVCHTKLEQLNEIIESDISILFPGQKKVFANWFSGIIRIPNGEIINYVHSGFASMHEEDLYMVFENGVLMDYRTVDNHLEEIKYKTYKSKKKIKKSNLDKIKNLLLRILNFQI